MHGNELKDAAPAGIHRDESNGKYCNGLPLDSMYTERYRNHPGGAGNA